MWCIDVEKGRCKKKGGVWCSSTFLHGPPLLFNVGLGAPLNQSSRHSRTNRSRYWSSRQVRRYLTTTSLISLDISTGSEVSSCLEARIGEGRECWPSRMCASLATRTLTHKQGHLTIDDVWNSFTALFLHHFVLTSLLSSHTSCRILSGRWRWYRVFT